MEFSFMPANQMLKLYRDNVAGSFGLCLRISFRDRRLFDFARCQILIEGKTYLCIVLRLTPQTFCILGFALGQHLETRLLLQELFHFSRTRSGIQRQRIFADERALRVIAIEQPLARIDSDLLI